MSRFDLEQVLSKLDLAEVELVRFLYVDLSGQIRGKLSSIDTFRDRATAGIGLVKGMMAMNMLDRMQTDTGLGATGEIRLVPDLQSFALVPYSKSSASFVCDMVELDHNSWRFCPRQLLKDQIEKARELGFTVQAAFEPEYMIGSFNEEGEYLPIDTSVCFGTEAMDRADRFYSKVQASLKKQGIAIEQIYPELGHGQHEISVKYVPALQACDQYITLKQTLRGIAIDENLHFSAAPKPFENQPGNGCHLHMSLWDEECNKNLTWSSDDDGISKLAKHFIAGLVSHLPSLVALTCPSVNSYRRLQPKSWSSAYTCWGYDNREAAVRVPSTYWNQEEASTNIELKCVDNTINPYLAMAAVIAAGIDGVSKELEPPPPVSGDPADLTDSEMEEFGVSRLPESLHSALVELETDIYLMKMMGDELANTYIMVKTSEVNAFALDSDFEYTHHRLRY